MLGCTKSISATITQPAAITITSTMVPVSCNGGNNGSIDITVAGGTPGFTFQWSNGQSTEDISNLPAGMYSVTVTDANGCTKTHTKSVTQPSAIALSLAIDIACDGLTDINLSVTGGTTCGLPAYTYQWSNGETSQDLSDVPSCETYAVTVTDCNGCVKTTSMNIPCVTPIALSTIVEPASCNGVCDGSIDLSVTGGFGGYTYLWTPGNQTTQDLSDVCSGIYTAKVTDSHGCIKFITVVVSQPTDFRVNTSSAPATCGANNGSGWPFAFLLARWLCS